LFSNKKNRLKESEWEYLNFEDSLLTHFKNTMLATDFAIVNVKKN